MPQQELVRKVLGWLNENHIPYMVSGSVVSSIQGEPRLTHDIDIVVNVTAAIIPSLTGAFLPPRYYLSAQSIKDALLHQSMFNLIDTEGGDKIDFWILTNEPYDVERFSRRRDENLWGVKCKVSAPEDTVLMKLKWARISGGSDKQFTDALRVFELQYENLDMDYLQEWAARLGVQNDLEKIRREANPVK